jgi:hypothetical protein
MSGGLPSALIMDRLLRAAEECGSEARIATLRRLVEACDAIGSGSSTAKTPGGRRRRPGSTAINATTVEAYVRIRQRSDPSWTGPVRVTIARDRDLNAYVEAREAERAKPARPKATPIRRRIEEAIAALPVEERQDIRHELERGWKARRELDLLRAGLRSIPGLDVEALCQLGGGGEIQLPISKLPDSPAGTGLQPADRQVLLALIHRLSDPAELRRAGLERTDDRIRVAASHWQLVKRAEIQLLERLAGEIGR